MYWPHRHLLSTTILAAGFSSVLVKPVDVEATLLLIRQQPRLVESVHRAAKMLSLFLEADEDGGLRVSDVARRLKVNKSTASRLFATLRDAGFVVADGERGCYYVGPAAYALGNRFSGAALARVVQHIIRDLSQRTASTAQFGMLQGNRVVFLTVNQGSPRLRLVVRPGDRQYVHASAMGKAILAALPSAERDVLIGSMLDAAGRAPGIGPRTLRDPAALRADADRTVKRGYSISNEESAAGMMGIGAYVANAGGIHTALSVAFPIHQHGADERPQVASLVVKAAAAARRLLVPGNSVNVAGVKRVTGGRGLHSVSE